MAQITNLNVSPYFDDFDSYDNFHKVLFKPGYPVQARELTTLQSILQNQIEKFGQHFFKEGAKVIPGNTTYNRSYYSVELNNTYLGVPVAAYASQLVGTKITGQTSGVTAVVEKVLLPQESERGNLTLYVNYLSSSTLNNSTLQFSDGELLSTTTTITSGLLGNNVISAGTPFGSTIAQNSTSIGSAFSIGNGVYFIRGNFVNVDSETLILSQYSNTASCRIGLYITEEIINSDEDETLNDNSQGFNNYAAPGADRFRISTSLFKKPLTDFNDNNFVELAVVENGVLRSQVRNTQYSLIADELARRTYDESGDYYVKPFDISVKESLNDNLGNRGVYNTGQFTQAGGNPSEDLALYQLSPGKAIIRGYDVETISPTFVDVPKPRTTKTLNNQSFVYNTGSNILVNRVYGAPIIGVGNTYVLSLRDRRVGLSTIDSAGKEIGVARVYDFALESGSYQTSLPQINQWNLSLYDTQLVTEITLNEPITLEVPTFVKGKNSGATAFIKNTVNAGTALTVYERSGNFVLNESFIFDGIENGRVAIAITNYSLSDVKSVYGIVGSAKTFTADTVQVSNHQVGPSNISKASDSGISTITSTNPTFPGNGSIVKIGNILKYSDPNSVDPTYVRVESVGVTSVTVSGVTTVFGVASGRLPTSVLSVSNLEVLVTSENAATDDTFYTSLPHNNISSLTLVDSAITIRKSFTVDISGNQLSSAVVSGDNETFLAFDEERYSLVRSNGVTEPLSADKFAFINGGTQLQIYGLGGNDSGANLITTLTKVKPTAKIKRKNRVNSIIIDKSKYNGSGIGQTTLGDGLSFGNYPYGTRVQDDIISLNVSDIIQIHGIYESIDTGNPSAPKVVLSSISGPTTTTSDLIIGEQMVGQSSGAIAIVAEKLTDSQISYILKNQNNFVEGESVTFVESNIQSVITTLEDVSANISSNFNFNNGQNSNFYNYGFVRRKSNISEPTRRLKVYFSNGFYESTDNGDLTTADSYAVFDYTKEIQRVNGVRNTDIIDIRPKVSDLTVTEGSRSPLEFYGRTFSSTGNAASNILASGELLLVSYSFYLGRIDRIYLSKSGVFQVKYGTPAEKPEKPVSVDESLEIGTITLPPYLYNVNQASISFLEHKRFRMIDIKQLENRIKNLEYYTTLSLLESNTQNMFIPDEAGLNRFKSGFFVDNFTSLKAQEDAVFYKNSIDLSSGQLRPQHYTNSIDLIQGPVDGITTFDDLKFLQPEGINIRKSEDIITLDYADVEWLKQTFATRAESVTPFIISFWLGTIELTPATDTWVDTTRLSAKIIDVEGNYTEQLLIATEKLGVDPQTGLSPAVWGSWETVWTGTEVVSTSRTRTVTTGGNIVVGQNNIWAFGTHDASHGVGFIGQGIVYDTVTTSVVQEELQEVRDTGTSTRIGTQTVVVPVYDQTSLGDKVVSRDVVPYMRSRNIEFVAKRIKPFTQFYGFFDGVNVTKYCVPKLLEVTMISGVFEVGETVTGTVRSTGLSPSYTDTNPRITFRVAQSNHQEGPYNAPIVTYPFNPYNPGQVLPSSYSATSTVLNVDTFSLSTDTQGSYSGYLQTDMILVGSTSGAQATISNLRLITDISSTLIGSFFIPNSNVDVHPRFETGIKAFRLINNNLNDQNIATSIAEENFEAAGTIETLQENILSVRNGRIETQNLTESIDAFRTTGTQVINSTTLSSTSETRAVGYYDPLAQSFFVDDPTGIFITKCDVFFREKDDTDVPVTMQIRTVELGVPTSKILPFSEIVLNPSQVNISGDSSVATTFEFKAPIYLEGQKEYAIVLLSNSAKYTAYVSRVGEIDLLTQTFISNQPYLGSLFKSQNASTWDASQWEDLKFTIYRADFLPAGSVEFYSPELTRGNRQIANLLPNSIQLNSRRVRVGITSALLDTGLKIGNTVSQQGINATGNYVGSAGIATGTLNIINAGIGYTPSSGAFQFNGVPLTTLTGSGRGATANITIDNGVAVAATVLTSGTGYIAGDVLGIGTIGNTSIGRNARLSVVSIGNTSELLLDNVQGNFVVGASNTVTYTNSVGLVTTLNSTTGGGVQVSEIITVSDGLHIKVNHKNHGMYFSDNYVQIFDVEPDVKPTKLSVAYDADSVSAISVDSTSDFTTFENVGVGTTNPGYLLIDEEVIEYTSASGGVISGNIIRGSNAKNYPVGTPVYKYELGKVSLQRINKVHDMSEVTVSNPITFDSYNVKLDMSLNGVDRTSGTSFPILYLNETKSTGGYNIRATQNMPFEIITPMVQNLTVKGTNLSAEIRTVSGSSISGDEIPFVDQGFEPISINQINYLDSPRLVCSKINEDQNLTNLPGNKSMNLRLILNTTDSRVSPVVDTQRVSTILTSNRVNSVITNYATDNRVNSLFDDPSAFQYISKEIVLANPSTSIQIMVASHVNAYNDIRAFYYISENPGSTPVFVPFPGYNNLDYKGEIISFADSNGLPNNYNPPSILTGFGPSEIEFKDTLFAANNLPSFKAFRIKLVMTSTSQVYVPRIKDLRVIALAWYEIYENRGSLKFIERPQNKFYY